MLEENINKNARQERASIGLEKHRGRPKKILSPEEILALENKHKKGRGRPRKILTPEEILALENRQKKDRGRPKKERTKQEILAMELSKERGKGRPKKELSPREQWFLRFAPKREKGRPKKDEILDLALPQIDIAGTCDSVKKEKLMPKLSWSEFQEKIPISDLTEDYIFPIIEQSQKAEVELHKKVMYSPRRVKVREIDEPSKYILDLRQRIYNQPEKEQAYAWEKTKEKLDAFPVEKDLSLLNFDTPNDLNSEDRVIQFTQVAKNKSKKKSRKISLIFKKANVLPVKQHSGSIDKSLVGFGKFLYFIWQIITAPFRLLDFIVDRTLKIIWQIISGFFKLIYKILNYNFVYIKKLGRSLVDRKSFSWALIKPLAIFVAVAFIIVAPVWLIDTWQKAQKIKGDVLGVSAQGVDYLRKGQFSLAENSFQKAQSEFESLGAVNNWLLQLVPKANDGQKLLRAGELAGIVGKEVSKALEIFSSNVDSEIFDQICQSLPGEDQKCLTYKELNLTDKLSYIKNTLKSQEINLQELIDIIISIDVKSVPKEYQTKLQQAQNNTISLGNVNNELNDVLDFLLEFLGAEKPKRYLIVFQNSREIRPTGGFMGSFALVDIYHGNVEKMDIPGGGLYDLKGSNQVLVAAPKPLQIFSPVWQIWNANWFPDWPTSAKKIMWFYENNTGGSSVDGVLALNQDVVAELLEFTGPIEMENYNKTLDQSNFINEVQMAVEYEYDKEQNQPKQIIADLAPKLLQNIINLDSETFLKTFLVLNKSLAQEKVLFYFTDEEMQKQMEKFNWAGEMREVAENQDYLSVIHTNISGGKSDYVINNQLKHKVEVAENGELLVTVSLTRKHTGNLEKIFEKDNNVDYVRFYAPQGSKFVSANGFNFNPDYLFKYSAIDYENLATDKTLSQVESGAYIDEPTHTRVSNEFNKTVFGNWIQVAPGQEVSAEIKYTLPFKFDMEDKSNNLKKWIASLFSNNKQYKYSLIVEKHPGMDAIDFSSQLVLPQDFEVDKIIKSSNFEQINNTEFSSSLQEDGYYGIVITGN